MPNRHSKAIWLPATLSGVLLLGIATSFWEISRRVDAHRQALAEVLEPANQRLIGFQLAYLEELAVWRAYQVRPTAQAVRSLLVMHERTRQPLAELDTNAMRVGARFSSDLEALRESLANWETAPLAVLGGGMSLEAFKELLPRRDGVATEVLERASRLSADLSRLMQLHVSELQRLERRRLQILLSLFPLSLLCMALSAWFAKRATSSHQRLLDSAMQESLVRDSMAALTGHRVLPVALHRIAANAMRISEAEGAFIEHCDGARSEVGIVAAVGTGAASGGLVVPFASSITDELVRAGTTELSLDLTERAGELGQVFTKRDERCFALAVPLSENGDVDGALVLVKNGRPPQLRHETTSRIHALGAWAALAMRRQQLASQLAAERARLEAVIEEIPVGVVLADAPTGRVSRFNRRALEMWGSPASPPQSIDEYALWQLFYPQGHEYQTEQRPLARSILTGENVRGEEAEVEQASGQRKPVRISSAPVRDSRGVIIAGVATIDDISEEKKREWETRFLDEISRQLASTLDYDATMEALIHLMVPRLGDVASIFHRQDDVIVRRLGTTPDDARLRKLFIDLDREYPLPLPSVHPVAVAIRTGKPQLRETVSDELLQAVSRDQRELEWLRSVGIRSGMAVPLTARGMTIGALQILSLNPARRYTCEDLRFLEEIARRAALAIDNAQLFRTVNETGQVAHFLAAASVTLSGSLEYEEILRRITSLAVPSCADFALAYLKDEQGAVRYVASAHRDASKKPLLDEAAQLDRPDPSCPNRSVVKALNTGQSILVERVTAEHLDAQGFEPRVREIFGELAPTSWMSVPLMARGKALGAIEFASTTPERRYGERDLTFAERLAYPAALAVQNAVLFQTVQEALATRDEVLAIVSHDLRNPLHTIGMTAELIREAPLEGSEPKRELDIIQRSVERMNRLIQDLLDVTRLEAGKSLGIEAEIQRPSDFIREACQLFELQAGEKHVRIDWTVPEETPSVSADHGRIIQVLSNLIGNAVKFTPKGGRIEVRAVVDKEMVVVSVKDSGPGIPSEDLERIFRPFWQARRDKRLGAGLGLAISRGIVEQHGGKVWAKSKEGVGSTFFFTLPPLSEEQSRAA